MKVLLLDMTHGGQILAPLYAAEGYEVTVADGEKRIMLTAQDIGFKGDVEAKILSNGEITKKVIVDGVKVSAAAAEKIKAAGGEIK